MAIATYGTFNYVIPQVSYGAQSDILSNKDFYRYFSRVSAHNQLTSSNMGQLASNLKLYTMAIIGTNDAYSMTLGSGFASV